jgi:hypothetical protein
MKTYALPVLTGYFHPLNRDDPPSVWMTCTSSMPTAAAFSMVLLPAMMRPFLSMRIDGRRHTRAAIAR